MSLDVLLVELWADEKRYKIINDNIGIAYLKASLDTNSKLSTGMLNSARLYFGEAQTKEPVEQILEYTTQYFLENPKLVLGVSCTQFRLTALKQLVSLIRGRHENISIMAGGYGPTFSPGEVLNFGVDAICIGEGDVTIVELVQALRGELELSNVAGIAYQENANLFFTQPRDLVDVGTLPFPSLDYINGRNQDDRDYSYAHRGCPYQCDFCFIHRFYSKGKGKSWRRKTANQIYQELRIRKKENKNLQMVMFGDDNFAVQGNILPELKELLKNDPITNGLVINFGLGSKELNSNWKTIESCIDIISSIEIGYESRVKGFLSRQRKGSQTSNMVDENHNAVIKLQNARAKYSHFDYAIYHILGDRHTSVQELNDIYPFTDKFDRLEWTEKILESGPNIVMYFDGRDKTYPLFMRAYCEVFRGFCRYAKLFSWVVYNITGHHRVILENCVEQAFLRAYNVAVVTHEIYEQENGRFFDIDSDLRNKIDKEIINQGLELHQIFSSFFVDLSRSLLLETTLMDLVSKPWLDGYSERLLERFSDPEFISLPIYVEIFARIFHEYEKYSKTLQHHHAIIENPESNHILQLFNLSLLNILIATTERDAQKGFEGDKEPHGEEAISDITILIEEMVEWVLSQEKANT